MCVACRRRGWKGQGARMLGMKRRRYMLRCSGDGVGGVGVMAKEELCERC